MMEFITDVTISIDEAAFRDPERLMEVLQSHRPEKEGSCYKVRGTYDEVDRLFHRLSAVMQHYTPATHGQMGVKDQQASAPVKSVDVSAFVMDYMEQKCSEQLHRICGNMFVIETRPDLRTVHKPNSTVQVTFKPHYVSMSPVRADFVRQRFITFYQRTASDLQIASFSVNSREQKDLQGTFPHLLIKPSHSKYEVTVIGSFGHIAKLKQFLLQNMHGSSKSHGNEGLTDTPSTRSSRPSSTHTKGPTDILSSSTSGPSPAHTKGPEDESCPICMEPIRTTEKETLQCKHSFCKDCLKQAFAYKPVCPTCGKLYGVLTGMQPVGGTMNVKQSSSPLPGYERYGTIIIHYYIPDGIQKEEHPSPGQPYEGVSRTAYLPNSSEGRSILALLRRAFDQRLIFTVGRSTTSGRNNTVTWNDIHHKTSTQGGPTHYGYPDPDYLSRVRDELAVKGIK